MKPAFIALAFLAGCALQHPVAVELSDLAKHPELSGKIIKLDGWLYCENSKCGIYRSSDFVRWLRDVENVQRNAARKNLDSYTIPKMPSDNMRIYLGRHSDAAAFSKQVAGLPNEMTRVILEARMIYVRTKPTCYDAENDQIICGGRISEAEPLRIVNIIRSVPLPPRLEN